MANQFLKGWKIVNPIGNGELGKVFEIQRTDNPEVKAAVKIYSVPQSDEEVTKFMNLGYSDEQIAGELENCLDELVKVISRTQSFNDETYFLKCEDYQVVEHEESIGWNVFVRTELLPSLLQYVSQNGSTLTNEQVINLGIAVCNALNTCKTEGIPHGNIKPKNIFVTESENYKLGDVGTARTLAHHITGTAADDKYDFMSPEVYNDQTVTVQSDIYSLGLVMYWLLNDLKLPFVTSVNPGRAERIDAVKRRISGEKLPAPAHGSFALKAIAMKACEADVSNRYKSPEEMKTELIKCWSSQDFDDAVIPVVPVYDTVKAVDLHENDDSMNTVYAATVEAEAVNTQTEEKTEPQKKKKGKGLLVFFLLLLLLLVIGAAFWIGTKGTFDYKNFDVQNYNTDTVKTLITNITKGEDKKTDEDGNLVNTPTEAVKIPEKTTDTPEPEATKAPENTLAPEETPVPTDAPVSTDIPAPTDTPVPGEHVHAFLLTEVPATCEEDGMRIYKCECGEEHVEIITAPGHVMGEFTLIKESTSEEPGEEISVCDECGYTETRYLPTLTPTETPKPQGTKTPTPKTTKKPTPTPTPKKLNVSISLQGSTTKLSTYDMKIGDKVDFGFAGASDWSKNKNNYELTWTTSDKSVVTVNKDGVVTAVGAGTAKVSIVVKNKSTGWQPYNVTPLKITVSGYNVGDIIKFGHYKLSADTDPSDIEWKILEVKGNKALVISLYILDAGKYNSNSYSTTWTNSPLNDWLDSTFMNAAFNSYEKAKILKTKVDNSNNPVSNTNGGGETDDYIFLLSIAEIEKYMNRDGVRVAHPTSYAIQNGVYEKPGAGCVWWLRSPGQSATEAACISETGELLYGGLKVNTNGIGVRPVMWIELN